MHSRFLALSVVGALLFGALAEDVRGECGDYVVLGDAGVDRGHADQHWQSQWHPNQWHPNPQVTQPLHSPCQGPNCESNRPMPSPGVPLSYEVIVVEPVCLFSMAFELLEPGASRYPLGSASGLNSGHPERVLRPPQA